jgi:feruloyl esterase
LLRSLDFLRYFLGRPDWQYDKPTLASMAKDLEKLSTYNADSPDLSAFRKKGGKVLMFHGLIDPTISARATTDYADKVLKHDATAANDVRLFMIPGMGHCAGGPGPSRVDWLSILDAWSAGGPAPQEVDAAFAPQANGQGGGARKLCAWPKKQVFKGAGDGRSPDQFECK